MNNKMGTRVLFLDDSGKPSSRDSSQAVVIGGFSLPSENVPVLYRRIAGAKSRFFAKRGVPGKWEVKATRTITPNAWKRSKNRKFLAEAVRILSTLESTVYTVSIDKRKMLHPMDPTTVVPLQLQALVEHFSVECAQRLEMGIIVSDWSQHSLDAHASQCVASFVISRRLPIHPSVYYASSLSSHAIQVADLVAGIRRRTIEGDVALRKLDNELAAVRTLPVGAAIDTHAGRSYTNRITLI